MKNSVKRSVALMSVAIFTLSLIANVKVTLDNPLKFVSNAAIAMTQSSNDSSGGGTSGESDHTSNFKSATVWYNSEISGGAGISLDKPYVYFAGSWTSMVCCINGADIDGCDFSLEDSSCAARVTRNAH